MSNNYFTSDIHFYSDATIFREDRPFRDSVEFITSIVNKWNRIADSNDTIYHLGDFTNYNKNDKIGDD